ncbi:MAG TPA: enoyl-CoA hydratase-related protein [Acidimicrobiales bacterium]|jgi:enoyl-CoA hydratase|nr:enoyl-CoA hydratase-related protein [Acidimicrobiales bacterium]
MSTYQTILVDAPATHVARITLNRPEKRNAISTPMRTELLNALRDHDHDPDIRVTVVRGAGPCFSAGYDLGGGPMMEGSPFYSAPGDGQWARQANDTWFSVWDLAKPVIAQIHGYAIAGATELASACDLVYVANDAQISYPVVRVMSPPDWQYHTVLLGMRRAMELVLTGDAISGVEAAAIGFANRAFPADTLEESVLAVAERVAGVPSDLAQINKRSVHRAFDVWGARAAIRAGTELQALAAHTATATSNRTGLLERMKATSSTPQEQAGHDGGTIPE